MPLDKMMNLKRKEVIIRTGERRNSNKHSFRQIPQNGFKKQFSRDHGELRSSSKRLECIENWRQEGYERALNERALLKTWDLEQLVLIWWNVDAERLERAVCHTRAKNTLTDNQIPPWNPSWLVIASFQSNPDRMRQPQTSQPRVETKQNKQKHTSLIGGKRRNNFQRL